MDVNNNIIMDSKWTSGNELKYLKQVLDNAKEVRDNAFTDRLESAFKNKYNVTIYARTGL